MYFAGHRIPVDRHAGSILAGCALPVKRAKSRCRDTPSSSRLCLCGRASCSDRSCAQDFCLHGIPASAVISSKEIPADVSRYQADLPVNDVPLPQPCRRKRLSHATEDPSQDIRTPPLPDPRQGSALPAAAANHHTLDMT